MIRYGLSQVEKPEDIDVCNNLMKSLTTEFNVKVRLNFRYDFMYELAVIYKNNSHNTLNTHDSYYSVHIVDEELESVLIVFTCKGIEALSILLASFIRPINLRDVRVLDGELMHTSRKKLIRGETSDITYWKGA